LNTSFLVSKDIYDKVKDQDCRFSRFDEIKLKGIEKPIEIYEVSKTTNNSNNGK